MVQEIGNITQYLSRNAREFPDKAAILHPRVISFKELDNEVDCFAAGLKKQGILKGTRTIILVSAGPDFFVLCFALLRIGAVPIMIDPGMGTKAMVNSLSGSDAEAFIAVPKAHLLKYIFPRAFRKVRTWINTGKSFVPGSLRYSKLRIQVNFPGSQCHLAPDEVAAIFFTSGSTGPPKGVIYQARTMEAQVGLMKEHYKYGPEDVDLCTFPLLGLFVTCLGSSLVIADMDPLRPANLNPAILIANINDFGCTQMFGSPMILMRLARYSAKKEVKLLSLRKVISAGAPVPLELIASFLKMCNKNTTIHTPYGATEALPVSDISSLELLNLTKEEVSYSGGICVGYPLPGVSIRIIEISDNPISEWLEEMICGDEVVGEIVVKGPLVTEAYHNNDQANLYAKIIDHSDGGVWHRMGDLGRIDKMGRLWFYGRKNHRVKSEKQTLYTIPTEAIFNKHPDVFRSALVGISIKNVDFEEPVICIQVESETMGIDLQELKKELLELCAGSEITKGIRYILFHPDFPVDPRHNAKIFREKLGIWAERQIR